ncbi:MAG: glucose-6-phosphate isomerase [Ruminococcaceae bacterium]|nr:glucose-6-phosphate isomerase [Oscillospiraceae bacterium]
MINVDITRTKSLVTDKELDLIAPRLAAAHDTLVAGTGAGSDFLGWVRLPDEIDREELARVKKCAEKIKSDSDVLVVIGIGGSYLGARAAIEFIKGNTYNQRTGGCPEVYFAGNNLSTDYLNEIIEIIGDRNFSINVISKSGSTTEPAVAFRLFKNLIEKKYGKEEAKHRIYATTDKCRGALKNLATNEGYETFVVPDNIGGRYSVLTAVGLLTMAVAGIDIDAALLGAKKAMDKLTVTKDFSNPAWTYVGARNVMYEKGKKIEILACFEPKFKYMAEWWKQLYGESEGKDNVGIFPASVEFTADLHSMGQYIQQGERILMETVVSLGKPASDIIVPENPEDFDGLNYLAGKSVDFVNENAYKGTAIAHEDGGVPNMCISLSGSDAESFGYMVYFFEFACGLSGYTLGVNPFDQPGVEAYKKNMFALLGKPGYEELLKEILEK